MSRLFLVATMTLAITSAFIVPAFAADQPDAVKGDVAKINDPSPANVKQSPPAKPVTAAEGVQKVIVNGTGQSDLEQRKRSTASRIIYGREELDRNGDSTIADVLKRLPGVTIGGRPGRGGEIRMRGMGGGYTQILLNGERAPRGFSMDSIPPDQVERIEIMRGPVAEYSTQAIAGTINIVLRQEYKKKDIDLKVSEGFENGQSQPNISISYPKQFGNLSVDFNGSVFKNNRGDEGTTQIVQYNTLGQFAYQKNTLDKSEQHSKGINFAPRISYRAENGDTFNLQQFIMTTKGESRSSSKLDEIKVLTNAYPANDSYANAFSTGESNNTFGRLFGDYQHKFSDNSRLTWKIGGGAGKMDSTSFRDQYDASGARLNSYADTNNTHDYSLNTYGKYSTPIIDKHTLATGLEFESAKRYQSRISLSRDQNNVWQRRFANDDGDNLSAKTKRIAVFAQDEFDISEKWSAYAGLRWEAIKTTSETASGAGIENTSKVWSPILHSVWRLPTGQKDQIRASLTQSYKAANVNDLIALPALSEPNNQSRPDRVGNPNLKPELAKGFDLAYEHYLSRNGIVSANFFARRISGLVRRVKTFENTELGQRWVSRPTNIGDAFTKGVELEAKFQLKEFFPEGPTVEFRANYSHFWTDVDGVKGPDNRLDQQPEQTGNFAVDYRPAGTPLTFGTSINWTPAYQVQTSNEILNLNGVKRQVDWFALWKINLSTQIRFATSNFLAEDAVGGSVDTTGGQTRLTDSLNKTYKQWTVRVELKL